MLENSKPTSFEELKAQTVKPAPKCSRCNHRRSTHSMSVTVVELDKGRGGMVAQLRQVPACESCAVEIFGVIQKALKQAA